MKRRSHHLRACALALTLLSLPAAALAAETHSVGKAVYENLCVRCHGPKGEGVADKHNEPLYGDRSLKSLARLIERTMPEEDPDKCVGDDAAKVAEYIFHAFYSPEARARMNPPKIDLARLTVPQYLNSVADLVASFRGTENISEERGLRATYYKTRNFKRDSKVFDRTDPSIAFDFGEGTPSEEIPQEEFSMQWRGSLIVEESGDYEFAIVTQNGARLSLNGQDRLIDAWVSSGNEVREERGTIKLLGGRAYPLELDFFTFKEKTASITLKWKPPHKAWEVIPQKHLTPQRVPEVLVVNTAFPADDGSAGYERGTAVSKAWDQAATFAAIEVAGQILEQLERITGVKDDAENRAERLKEFSARFAERAFRRPLTEEQRKAFVDARFEDASDLELALKRVIILVLKSPRFLYPELPNKDLDAYDIASRLSYSLWDSLPDQELLKAAARNELRTSGQIAAQTSRMLKDPRARAKLNAFFHHWLETEEAEDVSKDPEAYPDFSDAVLADMRTSLDLFLDDVVWSEKSNYQDLLLADYLYLNEKLAKFYGLEEKFKQACDGEVCCPEETEGKLAHQEDRFLKVKVDPAQRTGVLTHPYLLTAFAYYKSSSPIHRGVFLTRNIVGRTLKPPPQAIQFMDGRFDPSLTMREKVTELTRDNACMSCHSVINPLGFSLEHYDAVGRFRTTENNKPIDATSDYTTTDGDPIKIKGPRDVAQHAAASEEAHRGFIRQLFQQLVKQPPAAYGADTLEKLRQSFVASDFNIRKLVAEIVQISALHTEVQEKQLAATE